MLVKHTSSLLSLVKVYENRFKGYHDVRRGLRNNYKYNNPTQKICTYFVKGKFCAAGTRRTCTWPSIGWPWPTPVSTPWCTIG